MKYTVKVKMKNLLFLVEGRNVRSPFVSIVDDANLRVIKSKIKYYGLQEPKDYEIYPETPVDTKDYSKLVSKPTAQSQPVVSKPPTESKLPEKIKEEIKTIKMTDVVVQKQPLSNFVQPPKIVSDSIEKTEQNINVSTVDTEVKIEELSKQSSTILERILGGEF